METMTLSLLLLSAFGCGFLASRIGLPPLVGYLVAGFVLNGMGVEGPKSLQEFADLGILLLLFSIGLKLKIKNLARPEIWGCGTLHMVLVTVFFACLFLLLSLFAHNPFSGFTPIQALLLGFGLSFSSTVFAVKTFEGRGDMASLSAIIAIGILLIQDIAAVIYMTFTTGKLPDPLVLVLLPLLLLARPVFIFILDRCGHKELLLLFGLFAAIVLGAFSFKAVAMKPDLGALIIGILLARSSKAGELSDTLLSIKDLLLVGFFLNIGLSGLPSLTSFATALFFLLLLPVKSMLFLYLFSRFKLRARTGLFSTLALSNYSEFGLLVAMMAVQSGFIENEWVVTMAIALSLSFFLAAPLNNRAHQLYSRLKSYLLSIQKEERLPYDQPLQTCDADVLIFGMGRLGTKAYDTLSQQNGLGVMGIDFSEERVTNHNSSGRRVFSGDATDLDLWEKICTENVRLAMLTMASHTANLEALKQLKEVHFNGEIFAIAKFEDDRQELLLHGASYAYDLYQEAGQGFADELQDKISGNFNTPK